MEQTAILIAGEMAGSGVLALPRALAKTGEFHSSEITFSWRFSFFFHECTFFLLTF